MMTSLGDPGELPDIEYILAKFDEEKSGNALPEWVETLAEYCEYKASKPGQNRWKIHYECERYLRRLKQKAEQA